MSISKAASKQMQHRPQRLAGSLGRACRQALSLAGNTGGLITLGLRLAGVGTGFLLHILLARVASAQDYGIYAGLWSWVVVLGTLAPLGLSMAATRFVAAYMQTGENALLAGFLRRAALFVLLAGSLAGALLALFLFATPGLVAGSAALPALVAAAACLPLFAATELGKGIARGGGWQAIAYGPGFVLRPLGLIALVLGLLGLGIGIDHQTLLWASLAAVTLAALVQWLLIGRRMTFLQGQMPAHDVRCWRQAALPLILVEGQTVLLAYSDILLLQFFVPAAEVALYFVAAKVAAIASFFHIAVSATAGKPLAGAHAAGEAQKLRALNRGFIRQAAWPTLGAALVLALAGGWVLGLFGTSYVAALPILQVLLAGFVLQAVMGPLKFLLPMTGGHTVAGLVAGFSLALNLALNLVLIPMWGTLGAACATTATLGLSGAIMLLAVRRRLGFWSVLGA